MSGGLTLGQGRIDTLILQALVRKLLAKGVLDRDDVSALLFEAATQLDVLGGPQTAEAARNMVAGELAPAFIGDQPGDPPGEGHGS